MTQKKKQYRTKRCDVIGCRKFATIVVDGRLRLGPAKNKWVAVEFSLCPACEAEHDAFHGPPKVSTPEKPAVQP